MQVIHFTVGATDPLPDEWAIGAQFVALAVCSGETRVGCLHLDAGAHVKNLPPGQCRILLLVHGNVVFRSASQSRLDLKPGVGVVLKADEPCALSSEGGAIVLVVQGQDIEADEAGISTPSRIAGQRWPGDALNGKRSSSE